MTEHLGKIIGKLYGFAKGHGVDIENIILPNDSRVREKGAAISVYFNDAVPVKEFFYTICIRHEIDGNDGHKSTGFQITLSNVKI